MKRNFIQLFFILSAGVLIESCTSEPETIFEMVTVTETVTVTTLSQLLNQKL